MKTQRIFATLILILSCVWVAFAQEGMSIAGEITKLDTDLEARRHPVFDINERTCALIKVYTTADGLRFDTGSLGIERIEQKREKSEWWLYVQPGTEKLKVTHPQYGQLNTPDGYYHFAPLQAATVYRLELRTPRVDALEQIDRDGFLIFETQPEGAQVSILRHGVEVYKGVTPFQEEFHYGSYSYRVSKSGYREGEGVFDIDKDQVIVTKNLIPLISVSQVDTTEVNGKLQIITNPYFAEISVDNVPLGTTPRTLHLPVGEYDVMLSKQGYDTLYRQVSIAADSLTLIDEQLSAQESVSASVESPIVDAEYEEIQAELIERRRKQKEWLKAVSSPIQPRFEQMVLTNLSWGINNYGNFDVALGLNYILGYRFGNTFFLGAGVGFLYDNSGGYDLFWSDYYDFLGGSAFQIPLFGHLRLYFTGGKPVQFYMGATAGYIFEPDAELRIETYNESSWGYTYEYVPFNASSFYFSPGLGINIRTSRKFGLDFSVSYYGRNAICYSRAQQFHYHWGSGIKFNLGVTF